VLARCLADRATTPTLYAGGDYEPLEPTGDRAHHLIAFLRTNGDEHRLVCVPRLLAGLAEEETPPLGAAFWGDTRLSAPRGRWRDVVSGVEFDAGDDGLAVADLFAALPVAVLRRMG
jgi:(1->4)-alpha-D-glucan 1-alpha-D-glucosylmutase